MYSFHYITATRLLTTIVSIYNVSGTSNIIQPHLPHQPTTPPSTSPTNHTTIYLTNHPHNHLPHQPSAPLSTSPTIHTTIYITNHPQQNNHHSLPPSSSQTNHQPLHQSISTALSSTSICLMILFDYCSFLHSKIFRVEKG